MDIKITVIDRAGVQHQLVAPTDMAMNLMEVCKAYELNVDGICGGMAMCASCQIYVLNDVVSLDKSEDEQAMLDEAWHVQDNSRLACQIPISNEINGLKVELAPFVEEDDGDDW